MRAIAFGLIFVGMTIAANEGGDGVPDRRIDNLFGAAWLVSLVATLVCIIGGW